MADLNNKLMRIQSKVLRLRDEILSVVRDYESLYNEASNAYNSERFAGRDNDLNDFYILLQIIRRNKELMASILKGINSLRPMNHFRFVEEEIEEKPVGKSRKFKTKTQALV